MIGKTGQKCQFSGEYYCINHPFNEIYLNKGEVFPACQLNDNHETTWVIKREILRL